MINLTTDDKGVKIYRKDKVTKSGENFATYSLMVSSKSQDGNWINTFLDVIFKKGVSVNDRAEIKINNSFLVANEYNGQKYIKLMVMDFDVLNEGNAPQQTTDDGFVMISDDTPEFLMFN